MTLSSLELQIKQQAACAGHRQVQPGLTGIQHAACYARRETLQGASSGDTGSVCWATRPAFAADRSAGAPRIGFHCAFTPVQTSIAAASGENRAGRRFSRAQRAPPRRACKADRPEFRLGPRHEARRLRNEGKGRGLSADAGGCEPWDNFPSPTGARRKLNRGEVSVPARPSKVILSHSRGNLLERTTENPGRSAFKRSAEGRRGGCFCEWWGRRETRCTFPILLGKSAAVEPVPCPRKAEKTKVYAHVSLREKAYEFGIGAFIGARIGATSCTR